MDDAFKCGICYDYINTSMITPCGHSYCSICIRKSLLYKSACPICFEETFETSLRNNRVLDRLAELFSAIKDKLIKHLRIAAIHFNCNEQQSEQLKTSVHSATKNSTSTTAVLSATPTRNIITPNSKNTAKGKLNFSPSVPPACNKIDISNQLKEIMGSPSGSTSLNGMLDGSVSESIKTNLNESKIPTVPVMFLQPRPEPSPKALTVPTVPCPVCNVHIPERNINTHLDNCLANADQPPKIPVKTKNKRKPLAKMVWSLMHEKEIKKKLKEHGLSTQGDKKALITRIQKFITLYNSECDSENSRPISEIIRIIEKEEKQISQSNQNQQRLVTTKTDPRVIEENNKKYIQENKESFMKLIKEMEQREGRNIKPVSRLINRISDDTSDLEDNNLEEKSELSSGISLPSTSKVIVDHIDLCDSNGPSSPILDSAFRGFDEDEDLELSKLEPQVVLDEIGKSNLCKVDSNKLNHFEEYSASEEGSVCSQSSIVPFTSSFEIFNKSPRSESPSHTEPTAEPSDSEDSISLLVNQKIDDAVITDDALIHDTECTEGAANGKINSQLNDPDYVIDTEDCLHNTESEEVEIFQRKPKRKKSNKSSLPVEVESYEPRRTRRRLNK